MLNVSTASGSVLLEEHVSREAGFGFWNLFWQADLFVQFIMLLLLAASLWNWSVIFYKVLEFKKISINCQKFLSLFFSNMSLKELSLKTKDVKNNPMAFILRAVMEESQAPDFGKGGYDLKSAQLHRLERVMESGARLEMSRLERYLGSLATIGSSATFIGLLGTVWGIMNSFQSIASSKNTSLEVVAPGIAEALAATAFGLMAAIPAMVAYNQFAQMLSKKATELEIFCDDLKNVLSKNILEE